MLSESERIERNKLIKDIEKIFREKDCLRIKKYDSNGNKTQSEQVLNFDRNE